MATISVFLFKGAVPAVSHASVPEEESVDEGASIHLARCRSIMSVMAEDRGREEPAAGKVLHGLFNTTHAHCRAWPPL
ncbi:hypothetical protein GWL_00690 [Herbaspirillum sp. GW103]|nr:hypothetical protein GWL_00690 [Herbaspirillum sp. GW103]